MESLQSRILSSPAAIQWQEIGIRNHHGLALPLFSLHTRTSSGIGEYSDLVPLIHWCKEIGFDLIQLLPLNDTGRETSPYSALSAYALNPIHIGISSLPFARECKKLEEYQQRLCVYNNTARVDYPNVQQLKDTWLRRYYQLYSEEILKGNEYLSFEKKHSFWLRDYSVFKALKKRWQWVSWEQWPEDTVDSAIEEEAQFQRFLQYLCFSQLTEVKRIAEENGIMLKGDIPILISRDSADVWKNRELFLLEWEAGAPPDMYEENGQKWGTPLYDWKALEKQQYCWWKHRLEVASEFYHIYRIDHVVGFFRIWAVHPEQPAKEGHFIPNDPLLWISQGEKLMRMMLENKKMLPIGEDLGSVPKEVRECLSHLGICGTKVMRWEKNWEGDQGWIDPKKYPAESMTTVSTHDSEPLALWWIRYPHEAKDLCNTMNWHYYHELSPEIRFQLLKESHSSGSFFHVNLLNEYLNLVPSLNPVTAEQERINIPGTVSERNWSYRFLPCIEEITQNTELKAYMKELIK